MDAQQQELIDFLRNNLQVELSGGCDVCGDLTVQVTISLCGQEITSSSIDLPYPSSFDHGDAWPRC